MLERVLRWAATVRAATAIEYALLTGGIALAILLAVFLTGGSLSELFSALAGAMDSSAEKVESGMR